MLQETPFEPSTASKVRKYLSDKEVGMTFTSREMGAVDELLAELRKRVP